MPIPVSIIVVGSLVFCYALIRDKLWLGTLAVACVVVTGILSIV